ncbi:hypothetical protein Golax_016668 [Gossypium laxum]|uniref:Uncharacterized protein n=1 Tax=Gossypium laxum TaxID=34288 RepID=A0A7J8YYI2_9ROSI|nr:hypothetical protein [Gossypium laxum]
MVIFTNNQANADTYTNTKDANDPDQTDEVALIHYSQQSDFLCDIIKGSIRAQRRKTITWELFQANKKDEDKREEKMLRGVENKQRSGDSRIGQPFELLLNPWVDKRQPSELKHLSSRGKESKSDSYSSCKRNKSSLNRENRVVGEQ